MKKLLALDVIQLVLSVVGMFVFAFIFFVVNTMQRYLFLICMIYAAYSFIKSWQDIEAELKEIRENSTKKVKAKELKKVSA